MKIPCKKRNKQNNTGAVKAIVALVITAMLAACNRSGNNNDILPPVETYKQKIMTVAETEQASPRDFLSVTGSYEPNFWGDKFNVSGTIQSSATVAVYKDAVVRITYYSKTKTILGSIDHTVYELLSPYEKKNFEVKVAKKDDVESIGLKIISASAAQ